MAGAQQNVTRVQIPEMASVIRGIARGTIEWEDHPFWEVQVPKSVDGVDMDRFCLSRFYDTEQAEGLVGHLRLERGEYIEKFGGLDPRIRRAIEL